MEESERIVTFTDDEGKEYKIEIISENGAVESLYIDDNHQRFVKHKINRKANKIRFVPIKSWGCDELRLFDFEIC